MDDRDDFNDDIEVSPKVRANGAPNMRRQGSTGEGGDMDLDDGAPAAAPAHSAPKSGWGMDNGAPSVARVNSSMISEAGPQAIGAGGPEADQQQGPQYGRRRGGPAQGGQGGDGKFKDGMEVITDIAEIPDVEEELREDITTKVAEAPNVRSNRVQALQELDQAILFQLPTATADGIDLSLLTAALSPQEKVAEPDQQWDFDTLFSDVSSEMQAEMEPGEKEEGEEGEGDDKDDKADDKPGKEQTDGKNDS